MLIQALNYDWNVFCDADGVICDFTKKVQSFLPEFINDNPKFKNKVWGSIQYHNDNVEPFFESLDKMHDADHLVDFVRSTFGNVFILTACGFTPKDAADQKRRWFERQYGKDLIVKTVTKSSDKAQFASPNSILIDDRAKSIDPWVAAGGVGVLHTSAEDTIAQLEKFLRKDA